MSDIVQNTLLIINSWLFNLYVYEVSYVLSGQYACSLVFLISCLFSFTIILQVLISAIFYSFINAIQIKNKLFSFISLVLLVTMWFFYNNLDGYGLILLTTELFLLFIFIFLYFQHNIKIVQIKSLKLSYAFKLFVFIFYATLVITNVENFSPFLASIPLENYYAFSTIINNEEFIIVYVFFFFFARVILLCLTLILGYFSIIFILIFIMHHQTKKNTKIQNKSLNYLRKQNLAYQAKFNTKLRSFQ